ncbi:MAG: hypothetical protein J6U54_10355 [Clostridiales bacterium]|nr:hypothetical protein [Clostridiales bacterium]
MSNTTSGVPVALTTFDNPFDPFTQFNEWFVFDVTRGYNSCGYLARVARTSSQLTDEENNSEIERAIDEIISLDFANVYRKVRKGEMNPSVSGTVG